ncbi:cation-translocating P-type ATPase [Caballeronia arationis]|uniref:cation-translocating P-type ATPase n=1 Tax=Caballeronia arationis TaxID=1777142 RepID=UPI00190E7BF7|nr:HAD-IC family P-type ATPase [Caballeronia arationis]
MTPHTLDAEAVAVLLDVRPETGLSGQEALERLSRVGPNRLPQAPPRSPWSVLLAQFRSVLILILLGAVVLAALVGSTKDAVVILAVVVINALVGFYQEYRAERSLAALKSMLPSKARVRRDGVSHEIVADDVVPGDVLLLEAGDRVASDGRLWLAAGLEIDESVLTGESQPAGKQTALRVAADAPLGDRLNLVYMNTLLTRGRAEVLVTATGPSTEMGRLSQELAATEEVATPLQVQLDRLGKRLGAIALTLVGLLSFLQFLRGADLVHVALDAIALSVAAMPEGLPVVVTVTLALGMHKMARQHAIVKRLASVETLGCTTVICSDKTGTLTLNQMTARTFVYDGQRFDVSGEGYRTHGEITRSAGHAIDVDLAPLMVPMVACNDSRFDDGKAIGDPMEAALLVLAAKGGILCDSVERALPRLAELPFDSAHKFMPTFHRDGDQIKVFVKGAPDVLLARCTRWKVAGAEAAFGTAEAAKIDADYQALAGRGLRGLLIASRTLSAAAFDISRDLSIWIAELDFVGLVGLMDPPRPEAMHAITECRQAGIVVKMITGDHQATASAIASELGLHGRAVSGADIDRMDAAQLAAAIEEVAVFARVTPSHKVKIVRALQAKGHVVAMTGDGVNDAPALKQADVGVAMGISGTAVAKEAATMVLIDDNFATIVRAVRQGRTLYDNILKFVRFQLSTTIGAILSVFFAPLAGLPEPFTAIQILWVAIIMDGPPAVSLAMDGARPGIMSEPPRHRDEPVLPLARVLRIAAYGVTMMVGTLTVLYYGMRTGSEARALTMAFTTFVLFQFFNAFNARSESGSAFNARFFHNRMLWISLVGTLALQVVAVHWAPAIRFFGTTGMAWGDWGVVIGVASTVLLFEETRKLTVRVFQRRQR